MLKKISIIFSGIFLFITILTSFGPLSAYGVEYQSPRTLSLGGAGRGGPLLNDSIYLNPSYASFTPIYSLAAGYLWFDQGRNYNVSIVDSRTELFQAGAGYTKREQNSAINIGASKRIIPELGLGLGSKILLDNNTNHKTADFQFSAAYLASESAYVAFIVDNILQDKEGKSRNLYRTLYLGTKLIPMKEAILYLDPSYSPDYVGGKKFGVSVGVEFVMMADFYLRLGRFQESEITHLNTRGTGYGMGVGYIGPKVHFDYAMTRINSTHVQSAQSVANSVEMTVFF